MPEIIKIALSTTFRFIHEPLGTTGQGSWQRFVARGEELEDLAARILLSEGGAFLVTGYRGVGKTTFVNRVVSQIGYYLPQAEPLIGPTQIVDIYLNLARPMTAVELMYYILRSLYSRLLQLDLLKQIDPVVRHELELAFMRTTVSFGYKASDQVEKSYGLSDMTVNLPYLNLMPKLAIGSKRTRGSAQELSYLAYDDRTAEHDLIHISRSLAKGYTPQQSRLRKVANRILRRKPQHVRLKLVFIFDELDKIDEGRMP